MVPASAVALQVLIVLLPGFAAVAIVEALALRGKESDFQRLISACLYSFIVYSAFVLISGGSLPFRVEGQGTANTYVTWSRGKLWLLLFLTVVAGLVVSTYLNLDGNRIFRSRYFKLTERTTRHSIWNDIFERIATTDQIVQVEIDGDRSVIGVLAYYSDDADDCSLFITQAAWVSQSGETTEIPGTGILLTLNAGIRSVSLLHK